VHNTQRKWLGETRLNSIVQVLWPSSDENDASQRFQLRLIRLVAQLCIAAGLLPILALLVGIAEVSSPNVLQVIAGLCLFTGLFLLLLLNLHKIGIGLWVVSLGLLIPNITLLFGLDIQWIYPGLPLMFLSFLVVRCPAVLLQFVHLSWIAWILVVDPRYTFLPLENSSSDRYFVIYFAAYIVTIAFAALFSRYLKELRREIRQRETELAKSNQTLEQALAARTQELIQQQEDLIRARKLESLGTLAGGLAHDINNLLASIQINKELLESQLRAQDHPLSEELALSLERMQRGLERGGGLARRLLGLDHQTSNELEPIAVNALLEHVVETCRPHLGKIPINVVPSVPPVVIYGNRSELEQALLNLLDNAIDAMENHSGGIELRAQKNTEGDLQIIVEDEGMGIPPALKQRIFDPFVTGKCRGKGTGLGLAQAHRIITEHGGRIEARAGKTCGTTMTISLGSDRHSQLRPLPRVSARGLAGMHILLVEDEPDIASVIMAALPCHRFCHSDTGPGAVDLVHQASSFDLAILDMLLPGCTGRVVFEALRKFCPKLPVIIISGHAANDDISEVLSKPRTALLRKPFSLRELRNLVETMYETPRCTQLQPPSPPTPQSSPL